MRRTRIIHVLDRLTTGGTELVVLKLVAGLDRDLFEHMICALRAGTPPQLPANARYVTMASAAGGKRFLVPAMFRLFARERPDVVHSRNWGAIESIAAARLARVPAVVHSEHGRDVQTMHGLPWRRRAFRRICFPLANCVFAVTEELRQYYVAQVGKTGPLHSWPRAALTFAWLSSVTARDGVLWKPKRAIAQDCAAARFSREK